MKDITIPEKMRYRDIEISLVENNVAKGILKFCITTGILKGITYTIAIDAVEKLMEKENTSFNDFLSLDVSIDNPLNIKPIIQQFARFDLYERLKPTKESEN